MEDGFEENVGGAPPPKPKRPTVIRPAQKSSGGEPSRPVPSRPAPIARPSRPSPPTSQTKPSNIPKEPPTLPASVPSPVNGSRGSVKNKGGPVGAPKKKLEITILDARPMSEMGFRDMKGSGPVTSPTSPEDTNCLGKESPKVDRPQQSSSQHPPQGPSPSAPAASTNLLIDLEPDPSVPVRPKRPTIIRPSAVKQKQQDEIKDDTNGSAFPIDLAPPPKPSRPSVRQASKQQPSDDVDTASADSGNSEAMVRPARPSRPTIIRPQTQSKVSADQNLPTGEHRAAPSLPPPPSRPAQPPSNKASGKPSHLTSPHGASSLVPPSPKPMPRSTVLSSTEKENLIDLMGHEDVSPVPSPRPASRSPGEITPRSDASSTASSSGPEISPRSNLVTVSQSSLSSPSARESSGHSSQSAFPLLVSEPQNNVPPPKPAVPLPSPSGPPTPPKRPSAGPRKPEKSNPPADSLIPEDPDFKDDAAVYAKIDKSKKNTVAAASEEQHVNGKSKSETENVGLPFALKLKPTVPTDDTSDTPPAVPPKTKPKPMTKPKPKPKPSVKMPNRSDSESAQSNAGPKEQIAMDLDVTEGQKTGLHQGAENLLADTAQEEPPPLKPKQISGSFLAKFEQMSASQPGSTENKDKPSNFPPVPSKRPVTIIGAPPRQKRLQQSTQEQHSASPVSEVLENKPESDEKPSPPVPTKRPVTMIGFPKKNSSVKKIEVSEEKKESEDKDNDKDSITVEQETSGGSFLKQESALPGTLLSSGSPENNKPLVAKPQESEELLTQTNDKEITAVKQKPARPGGPPPRPSAPAARKSSSPGNNHPKVDEIRQPDPVLNKVSPPKSEPSRPAPPKAQPKPTGPPPLPVRPRRGHPLYHHMADQPHGIALHDYTATQPDELSFQEGDTIVLVKEVDDQWMLGKVGSDEGIFPVAFVDIKCSLGTKSTASADWPDVSDSWPDSTGAGMGEKPDNLKGPRCRARFDFEGDGEGELALEDGDIIQLLARVGTEWFKGELNGRVGIFPASFVDIIQDLPPDGNTGEDIMSTRVSAIFDFEGQEGELNFQAGDNIEILSQVNDEWMYGQCNGMEGQFPSSFISHVPPNLPKYKKESSQKMHGHKDHKEQRDQKKSKDKSQSKKEEAEDKSLPANYVESREEILGYCRGMYDYDDAQPGDLAFKAGDRIEILEFIGEDWARGRLGRKEGMFPLRFVAEEIIDESAPPIVKEPEPKEKVYGKVIHDFNGETADDLTIKEGDVIEMEDIADINGHWQWGWLNGKKGMFPTAFVEAL